VKGAVGLKVLGYGDVSVPLTVRAAKISASAREKILAAGGRVEEG
jgi:large subunit ribosomal protein L15